MNSPEPFESIVRPVRRFGAEVMIGVGETDAASLLDGACDGLGICSSLYKPDDGPGTVGERARRFTRTASSNVEPTSSG